MYCHNCGREVKEGNFCPYCGAKITARGYSIGEDSYLLLTLKPVFVPSVVIFSILPLQIFFTIWGGIFFGGIGLFIIKFLKINIPEWSTFALFSCLFFFGLPIAVYITKKKNYEKTEYRFYNTKLEYYEGFLNIEEKTIHYKNITEVYLKKNIIQRRFGLGTIILSTPATGNYSPRGQYRSGIIIPDIKNPDENYKKIKELINKFV